MPAMCEACTGDEEVNFKTIKDLLTHKKSGHKTFDGVIKKVMKPSTKDVDKPVQPPKPEDKREPIKLEYHYMGTCETCGKDVETIRVELGEKDMMIAYCSTDRKQWTQREVIPIDQQNKLK